MSRYSAKLNDTLLICFFRMLMCIGTSAVILAVTGGFFGLEITPKLIGYAAFSGISTAILVAAWLFAANSSGYMMLEVFQMLGVGVTDFSQKAFIYSGLDTTTAQFQLCSYVFAAVTLIVLYAAMTVGKNAEKKTARGRF